MHRAALFALAIFLPAYSWAADENVMTVANLMDACTRADMHWVDFCNGYMQGVHDAGAANGLVCAPEGVTRTELVEGMIQAAARLVAIDRTTLDAEGFTVVLGILQHNYPCN